MTLRGDFVDFDPQATYNAAALDYQEAWFVFLILLVRTHRKFLISWLPERRPNGTADGTSIYRFYVISIL